jgi:hypothetical protein
MEAMIERIVAFALVGLASGFASGLFGIGGGIDPQAACARQSRPVVLPDLGVRHFCRRADRNRAGAVRLD